MAQFLILAVSMLILGLLLSGVLVKVRRPPPPAAEAQLALASGQPLLIRTSSAYRMVLLLTALLPIPLVGLILLILIDQGAVNLSALGWIVIAAIAVALEVLMLRGIVPITLVAAGENITVQRGLGRSVEMIPLAGVKCMNYSFPPPPSPQNFFTRSASLLPQPYSLRLQNAEGVTVFDAKNFFRGRDLAALRLFLADRGVSSTS